MATSRKRMKTNTRVINETLTKYKDTFRAFMELVNNSLQAKASKIDINIEYFKPEILTNTLVNRIEIVDNGTGVPYSEFENTIMEIGTTVKPQGHGVGRFSAFQIGSKMSIETTAFDRTNEQFSITSFSINSDDISGSKLDDIEFDIPYDYIPSANSGYKVCIENLHSNSQNKIPKRQQLTADFLPNNINQALFENYPSEIFNNTVQFLVNDVLLKRADFVISEPQIKQIDYKTERGEDYKMSFCFYNVKLNQQKVKVFMQTENAGILSVAHEYTYSSDWYTPDLGTWFIYINSSLFNSDLFRNIDMDSMGDKEMLNLKTTIKTTINDFFKVKNKRFEKFVSTLEQDKSYPYNHQKANSVSQESLFKKAAYILEDEHQLLKNDNRIRTVIYPLLDLAIANGDIEYIFQKVSKMSPDSILKFKALLQETDLDDIVRFSGSVAKKLKFLDLLNELTYGDISKVLLERKQLHKIIEKELWIFGEQYAFTPNLWSDKQLQGILESVRSNYFNYELTTEDENLINVENDGLKDVTDLFFFNEKIADDGVREIMVVELKKPTCAISQKEIEQINRYAYTLETYKGLPADKVRYKLILISTKLTGYAKSQMKSKFETYKKPFLYDIKTERNIKVYIMEWAELIEQNKRSLGYLSNQLTIKESDVREVFEKEYPELVDEKIRAQLTRSK